MSDIYFNKILGPRYVLVINQSELLRLDVGINFDNTSALIPSVPVISSVTIDGTPTIGVPVGVTVSCTGYPTPTYTYVWKLDGAPIDGATGTAYTPVEGDVGGDLSCTVTATNSEGSDAADSNSVEVVAVLSGAFSIAFSSAFDRAA